MRLPALRYWATFDPRHADLGHVVDVRDDGTWIFESATGELWTLEPHRHLKLRAECPVCGAWTPDIDRRGAHVRGCSGGAGPA